jgi:hypothetical protein
MAQISMTNKNARTAYIAQTSYRSGKKPKRSSFPQIIGYVVILYMVTSFGGKPARAQAPSPVSAQQTYLDKLVQLQITIDAADVDVKNQLYSARADISQLDLARLQKNVEADTELKNELTKLTANIAITAFAWPGLPPDEQFGKIKEFAADYARIGQALLVAYQDDTAARQRISQAGQKLASANSAVARLKQLKADRARLASEGQKAGLLPNVSYDAKKDQFTVTSPARALAQAPAVQVAQAGPQTPAAAAPSGPFVIPTTPDPLAISMLYQTYFVFQGDSKALEAFATRANMAAFAKCMIEHRTSQTMRPNELWEFVTHSAAIVRSKNMANQYWPPTLRMRSAGPPKSYEFKLTLNKSGHDLTKKPVNALWPDMLRSEGVTSAEIQWLISYTGLSSPEVCAKTPASQQLRQQRPADDDDGL